MQIVISAVIATVVSLIILNFGEDIWDKIRDAADNFREYLSEKRKQKRSDK